MAQYFTGQFGIEQAQFGWIEFGWEAPPQDANANLIAAGYAVKTATIEGGPVDLNANAIAGNWQAKLASPGYQRNPNVILGGWAVYPATREVGNADKFPNLIIGNWQAKTATNNPTELFPNTINGGWQARTAVLPKTLLEPDRIPFAGFTYEVKSATITATELTATFIPAVWGPTVNPASINGTQPEALAIAANWGIPAPSGASMVSPIMETQTINAQWQAKESSVNKTQLEATQVPGAWAVQQAVLISSIIDAHVIFGDWAVKPLGAVQANVNIEAQDPGFWQILGATLEPGNPFPVANVIAANWANPHAEGNYLECWEPLTQRLLAYLAAPFKKDSRSLLGRFMAAISRELSGCTQEVRRDNDTDVRGNGTLTITTRFDPILSVTSVQRIDNSGAVLETYTVSSFKGRTITLTGGTPPGQGDRLRVNYTYEHHGLEYRIRLALAELNILTSTGEFLDNWGRLFGVPRLTTGKYGSFKYGTMKYGTSGTETDAQYARRIIDRVLQVRNTKPSILAAVKRITGGDPYMVEWFEVGVHRGWVYKRDEDTVWMGDNSPTATKFHLIWGETARFLDATTSGGGGCVAEVWVPPTATASLAQIEEVAKAYKAAGIKVIIRQFTLKKKVTVDETGTGTDAGSRVIS